MYRKNYFLNTECHERSWSIINRPKSANNWYDLRTIIRNVQLKYASTIKRQSRIEKEDKHVKETTSKEAAIVGEFE